MLRLQGAAATVAAETNPDSLAATQSWTDFRVHHGKLLRSHKKPNDQIICWALFFTSRLKTAPLMNECRVWPPNATLRLARGGSSGGARVQDCILENVATLRLKITLQITSIQARVPFFMPAIIPWKQASRFSDGEYPPVKWSLSGGRIPHFPVITLECQTVTVALWLPHRARHLAAKIKAHTPTQKTDSHMKNVLFMKPFSVFHTLPRVLDMFSRTIMS